MLHLAPVQGGVQADPAAAQPPDGEAALLDNLGRRLPPLDAAGRPPGAPRHGGLAGLALRPQPLRVRLPRQDPGGAGHLPGRQQGQQLREEPRQGAGQVHQEAGAGQDLPRVRHPHVEAGHADLATGGSGNHVVLGFVGSVTIGHLWCLSLNSGKP